MAVDPVDDCTFWYTSEYLQVNGTFNWSTRVASFKFSSCGEGEPPVPGLSLGVTPASRTVTQGQATSFSATVTAEIGYSGSGGFSVTGLPANTTGVFSPNTFSGGAGAATLNVTTAANTPTGAFPLTITAQDASGTPSGSKVVTLTVNPALVADFTITASPNSRNIRRGNSGSFTVSVTPLNGFSDIVGFSVTGCPAQSTCTFSPGSVNGGGTSTLTVATAKTSPKGTFALVITGTSTAKSHSTSVNVKLQ
jgi:hypothetical protein